MSEACVILAAGKGSRLGGQNKALLRWKSQTFLSRIVESCKALGIAEIVAVVAAPHQVETETEAERLGIYTIANVHPEDGMASSVACGFEYALREFLSDYAWLWPVDSPAADSKSLLGLSEYNEAIVIPTFRGRGGHPARVHRSIWSELGQCQTLDEGARTVFRHKPERVVRVELGDARLCQDVDSPEDLRQIP